MRRMLTSLLLLIVMCSAGCYTCDVCDECSESAFDAHYGRYSRCGHCGAAVVQPAPAKTNAPVHSAEAAK